MSFNGQVREVLPEIFSTGHFKGRVQRPTLVYRGIRTIITSQLSWDGVSLIFIVKIGPFSTSEMALSQYH